MHHALSGGSLSSLNAKLIYVKENTSVRPVIESGLLEELIDQFCDLLRRVLMAVVANAL